MSISPPSSSDRPPPAGVRQDDLAAPWRLAADRTELLVVLLDAGGNLLFANRACLLAAGLPSEASDAALGRPFAEICLAEADRPAWRRDAARLALAGETTQVLRCGGRLTEWTWLRLDADEPTTVGAA